MHITRARFQYANLFKTLATRRGLDAAPEQDINRDIGASSPPGSTILTKLSSQAIFNLHLFSNLCGVLIVELIAAVGLWHLISPWWLWLLVFVPAFLLISNIGVRVFPFITGPIIDSLRPDADQYYTKQGDLKNRLRKPLDVVKLISVFMGLCLVGYATIDSFITDSMPGFRPGGFFRVYRVEEPVSFWIYASLCVCGTVVCVWGVIYLLTADRYRMDDE